MREKKTTCYSDSGPASRLAGRHRGMGVSRWCVALGVVLMAAWAAAGEYAVQQVVYSTGAQGSQLKWLPYQPRSKNEVRAALAAEPIGGPSLDAPSAARMPPEGKAASKTAPSAATPQKPVSPDTSSEKAPVPELAPKPKAEAEKPPAQAESKPLAGEAKAVLAPLVKKKMPKPDLQVAAAPPQAGCPPPDQMRPIREQNILERVPPAPGVFPQMCSMTHDVYQPRAWAPITFTWKASALCSKPVYFEDPHLERYGHMWGPCLQPFMSAGHFFLAVPALPYLAGLYPPNECIYTLGYYRPGSCAPYILDPFPLSVRAALCEGAAATGLAFLLP